MKNKKEGLFIQCIVCSLLPLITLFIPYLKFGISVPLLGKVMEQLTGMDLLKVMGNVNNLANSELAVVCIPSSRQLKKYKIFVLPGWISGNIFMPPIVAFHEIPLVLRLQVLSVAGRLYSNLYIL